SSITTLIILLLLFILFFFIHTATPEIYTLSLHDALPISPRSAGARTTPEAMHSPSACRARIPTRAADACASRRRRGRGGAPDRPDRKSTRLNSSHSQISYAVFCLKKKKKKKTKTKNKTEI